jgi:hypothetical protein
MCPLPMHVQELACRSPAPDSTRQGSKSGAQQGGKPYHSTEDVVQAVVVDALLLLSHFVHEGVGVLNMVLLQGFRHDLYTACFSPARQVQCTLSAKKSTNR